MLRRLRLAPPGVPRHLIQCGNNRQSCFRSCLEWGWPSMPAGLGLDVPSRHCIGVRDVYRSCARQGALDSAIAAAEPNDFASLETNAPQLRRVCFNGKTSGKFERWFLAQGYDTLVLPSSSPV